MTVTTSLNYKEYLADGKATVFTIPFLLFAKNDLSVYLDNQPITIDYSISGIGNSISEITFTKAPLGRLLLQRTIKFLRETDYQENGDLLAKTINQDFDRLYLAMQGLAQDNTKAIRVTDPEGINALPLANDRANKLLGFDSQGQPMLTRVETNSAIDLAQKLADTTDAQVGASMVGYNNELSYPHKTVGNALNTLSERCDKFEGNGVPAFSVLWWPSRTSIPAGYVAADGQELSQAAFPDIANAIQRGDVPTVSEQDWQTDPIKRGSYVANSSQGQFRLPDYNGNYADSLGALFLRGDNGLVLNGNIQPDALQGHGHVISSGANDSGAYHTLGDAVSHIHYIGNRQTTGRLNQVETDGAHGEPRVSNETQPINVSGCWIIKLFSSTINVTEANIQQLITDNANLLARLSTLESWQQAKRFTIIYPNGGTAQKPDNVEVNKRYEMANPFPNQPVICQAEILVNGVWGTTGYATFPSYGGACVTAGHLLETDKIIIQTSNKLLKNSVDSGGILGYSGADIFSAPCRIKVWRVI